MTSMPRPRLACGGSTLKNSAGKAISVSAIVLFAYVLFINAGCLTVDAVRPAPCVEAAAGAHGLEVASVFGLGWWTKTIDFPAWSRA